MSEIQIKNQSKNWVAWRYIILSPFALMILAVLFIFDTPIWQAARDLVEPDYLYIPELFTHWGIYLFYLIFAVILIYAFIQKNQKLVKIGLAYMKAQFVFSLIVVRLLKILLGRARPGYDPEFAFFETSFKYNAFPSGHSADAFVSGVFLYYLLKQSPYTGYRFLPLIFAFLIAVSRVFVSSHYPSDVAAGMVIGILGARFFLARYQRSNPLSADHQIL
jgi:undecaprenyl-diphosphatase